MAGISIRLEKLLKNKNYTSNIAGYLVTTFAVAGPWIITIVVLSVFSALFSEEIRYSLDYQIFNSSILYGFIFSQIITVPFQFIVTRYLADEIYRNRTEFIKPTYLGLLNVVFVISAIVAGIIFFRGDVPLFVKVMSSYFLIVTTMVWVSAFFLSALGDFMFLGKAFLTGAVLGFLSYLVTSQVVPPGDFQVSIIGLTLMIVSMTTIFIMVSYKILTFLTESNGCSYDFIRSFSDYPSLFFVGLFYVIGLWIDKFLIWTSDLSMSVAGYLQMAPAYDQASFILNLFIIPSNVLFLSLVEVEFIGFYRKYFEKTREGTYADIKSARFDMRKELFINIFKIVLVQTVICMFLYLFVDQIFSIVGFDVTTKQIFVNMLPGLVFYTFIIISVVLFLYFEERIKAVSVALGFLILNGLFTFYYLQFGTSNYGLGFTIAAIVINILAIIYMVKMVNQIDYKIFGVKTTLYIKRKTLFTRIADRLRVKKGVNVDE